MSSKIDIIIPIYNEAENLVALIGRLDSTFHKAKLAYHLYFVDDHSTDRGVKILNSLKTRYPITILTKNGNQGKAYSILEGAAVSTAPYIAMIDADLQYPPEIIPEMLALAKKNAVVVAKRNDYQESKVRHFLSKGFQWFFGKVLHGLDCDVQSGLKVFSKEVIKHLSAEQVTAWTLDIPLLTTAMNLGYDIKQVDITFEKRAKGESKIKLITSIKEIGGQAISYKLKHKRNIQIPPENKDNMLGAGMYHKGKRFITHTTLLSDDSAVNVITQKQKAFLIFLVTFLVGSFFLDFVDTIKLFVAVLSAVYFADVFFNLYVVLKSLKTPPEIKVSAEEIFSLADKDLPTYTVLCPLYKEAHVLPQFVSAIEKMEWPKKKLDVILLLEADDLVTIDAASKMKLPSFVSVQVVPDSQPKTKPKACNYGLHFAKGEFLVIYDAEDVPDPLQLKKVYLAFLKSPTSVKCIQAKLNFYNPYQNLLTRFFTAEYSLWFDVVLTGLQGIETSLPLGGTSNHFRTQDLKDLEGWDSFNVTEDADLGIRLFKRGGRTAIIDSITLEEANSSWSNWLRQRSRWIKGYMQTYLVHMRNPYKFFKEYGWHALLFQLVMGGKIAFMLINPFMWLLTVSYFGLYAIVGPTIESFYPSIVFYMAVTSLVFGNFLFIYYYMIGAAKREHWSIIKWVFLVPIYWLLVSVAATIALYQLIVKPHYWEKTVHGLHVKKTIDEGSQEVVKDAVINAQVETEEVVKQSTLPIFAFTNEKLKRFTLLHKKMNKASILGFLEKCKQPAYRGAFFLILANIAANVLNLLTNIYTGHVLPFADFGVVNTFTSILYLLMIPTSALATTINHQTAFLMGKYKSKSMYKFWGSIRKSSLIIGLILSGLWVAFSPALQQIFGTPTIVPILVFAPLLFITILTNVDRGYIKGRMMFGAVALVAIVEPLSRIISTVVIAHLQWGRMLYLAIPISTFVSFLVAYHYAKKEKDTIADVKDFNLPSQFFWLALLAGLSTIAFFSLDNILVAHYLGAEAAGKYAFLGLIGKIIYFAGNLILTFITPIISHQEGSGKKTDKPFVILIWSTALVSFIGFVGLGLILPRFGAALYSEKLIAIATYLPLYCLGIALFNISQVYANYHLAKRNYLFPFVAFVLAIFQVIGFALFHRNLQDIINIMFFTGLSNLVVLAILDAIYFKIKTPLANVVDALDLFNRLPFSLRTKTNKLKDNYSVLFFNWRDTKHVWAGGAEYYIQEIAEELVRTGHNVTIFCGNDGKNPRNEKVNGVQIIRRGGFYTVYFWAFVYYQLKLKNLFDVIVDCENGIPFLTPIYSKQPVFLLIHHIHQEVFRQHLPFPLSAVANFIEGTIMPVVYRTRNIITVSESSKTEIIQIGLGDQTSINIVNPGVSPTAFTKKKKTTHPSVVYIGRLKQYKNVHVLVEAFASVLEKFPKATLTIGGSGEARSELILLAQKLGIESQIVFIKDISNEEKVALFAKSWVAVQPSMIEGWGITVIEANAAHTPVIASNVKGLKDSIQNGVTGILVEPKQPKLLAEAIINLFDSPKLRTTFSENAYKWAQEFIWEKKAARFLQILESSLNLTSTDTNLESNQNEVAKAYEQI